MTSRGLLKAVDDDCDKSDTTASQKNYAKQFWHCFHLATKVT